MTLRSPTTDYPHAEPLVEHEQAVRTASMHARRPHWHDDEPSPLAALDAYRDARSWHLDAACAGKPGDWWYPVGSPRRRERVTDPYARARAVCARCPVATPCLADALERGEQWGMWGGLDPDERRALRRTA